MKGLTLHRPWDYPVVRGIKPIENRRWQPHRAVIGQWVAIHAGLTYDESGAAFIEKAMGQSVPHRVDSDAVAGHIVGLVRVVAAFHKPTIDAAKSRGMKLGRWESLVAESPWAFGPWCWVLEDAFPLVAPVPCKGAQSLWPVPKEIEAALALAPALIGTNVLP